ncbi:hypothetical protein EGW08_019953, partial [Elysia chlorotica]
MKESFLWLLNHIGDTFRLGTNQRLFSQIIDGYDDVIAIKRVAASHWCVWAVGHDHRPYLYVLSSDVPIRIPETTYENQRWSPFYGFSKKSLLRSDRYSWSDESGTVERPKESVRLPSSHWEWDGEWMIDDNLRGEVVELGGWQYALDFPAVYAPEQHWNSFVRRRKWIHFRRFFATDRWANISDMEMVEKAECFIDISVGGFLLPSQPDGFLMVWAVMNSGSVYVRTDVHRENPEGSAWRSISLEKHHGVINISVGATNLVWAVTWDGQGLVRTNVSRNNIYGSSWVGVESPDNSTQLMQIAVGRNAVWALSRDNKVWFRKGTWGDHTFWCEASAVGTLWVEMVGEMSQIALSSNDQVFAIDLTTQYVYFRTGVSSHDLTGKTWQKVSLHEDLSQFKDLGLLSDGRLCSCTLDDEEFCEIHGSPRPPSESTSCSSVSLSTVAQSVDSSPANQSVRSKSVTSIQSAPSSVKSRWSVTRRSSSGVRSSPSVPTSLELRQSTLHGQTPSPGRLSFPSLADAEQMPDSVPGQVMVAAQPRLSWKWLDVTNCVIDDPSRVDWLSSRDEEFSKMGSVNNNNLHPPPHPNKAYIVLMLEVKTNSTQLCIPSPLFFSPLPISFMLGLKQSTWVRKAAMQMFQHGRRSRWIECSLELEQGIGSREKGTLTVHYTHHRKQMHTQIQLSDMTCIMMNTDPDLSTVFNVFTPTLTQTDQPLMLKAASEKDATEWLDYLSSARASAWNLNRPIPPGAVWSCSFTGDVLVSPSGQDCTRPYLRSWGLHGGHMALIETSVAGVTWALGFDKTPHVYNGGFGGAVCTGQSDMSYNTQQLIDSHRVYVYENQKWFPVVGWCNKGVFKHNFHWVTSSGRFVTSRDQVKLPSSKWNWVSDWTIDFSTSGGVDSNGWQYSNQFNGPFHRSSHIRDQYRRRRWVRRCRLSLMGPWISAGSLSISDLSIQLDSVESASEPVVMWAVAANGDVLCRYGVTQSNPLGESWVHVSRDQDKPFTSISVGSRGQVWGLATDGSAWYRTGVGPDNPAGKHWLQVVPPPPGNFRLHQVSVGVLSVWAVDTGG